MVEISKEEFVKRLCRALGVDVKTGDFYATKEYENYKDKMNALGIVLLDREGWLKLKQRCERIEKLIKELERKILEEQTILARGIALKGLNELMRLLK